MQVIFKWAIGILILMTSGCGVRGNIIPYEKAYPPQERAQKLDSPSESSAEKKNDVK